MDTQKAAHRWADTWRRAWPERDLEAVVALYAADGVHRSAPFREPYVGQARVREYFGPAFDSERSPAVVWFGEPLAADGRATVEWWALVDAEDGAGTIAGCSLLHFDDTGAVVEQRDYWHEQAGHVQRPFA